MIHSKLLHRKALIWRKRLVAIFNLMDERISLLHSSFYLILKEKWTNVTYSALECLLEIIMEAYLGGIKVPLINVNMEVLFYWTELSIKSATSLLDER